MSTNELRNLYQEYVYQYSRERGFSPKTIENKEHHLGVFMKWLSDRPFDTEQIRVYLKIQIEKGLMPNTRRTMLRHIKAFDSWLVKRKHIKESVASEIEYPKKVRRHIKLITAETAEKVIQAAAKAEGGEMVYKKARHEQALALQFILRTGLRVSECLSLKGSSLQFDDGTFVVVSKGGNTDVMPMPRDMIEVLKQRADYPKLFKTNHETLNVALKRGCKLLEVKEKITVHSLRHIFCTSLLRNGVPLQRVSRLMRHSTVQITDQVYSHYLIDDLKTDMNSHHPVIRQQMSADEVFDQLEQLVEQSGLKKDKRFNTVIEREELEMGIRLTYQH